MSTTSPVVTSDPTSWIAAAASEGSVSYPVTPDALMAMLQLRLQDCDGQIANAMTALNNNTANANRLSNLLAKLNELKEVGSHNGVGSHHLAHSDGIVDDDLELGEYMTGGGYLGDGRTDHGEAVLSDDAVAQVNQALREAGLPEIPRSNTNPSDPGGGDDYYKATDIQASIDNVTQHLRDANSGNDQLMIQVQSMTQSRTTNIQMVTNMLKAMNDSLTAIASNLK